MKWVITGAIGGWICGFLIFSITALIGKSGDTGTEYFGYWSPAYIVLAMFYGVPVGVVCVAIVRIMFYKVRGDFLFDYKLLLGIVVLLSGLSGWLLLNPLMAPVVGGLGFIVTFCFLVLTCK